MYKLIQYLCTVEGGQSLVGRTKLIALTLCFFSNF